MQNSLNVELRMLSYMFVSLSIVSLHIQDFRDISAYKNASSILTNPFRKETISELFVKLHFLYDDSHFRGLIHSPGCEDAYFLDIFSHN